MEAAVVLAIMLTLIRVHALALQVALQAAVHLNFFMLGISQWHQRAFIALWCLFLYSCSNPVCRQWIFLDGNVNNPIYNSGRMVLNSNAKTPRLELEIDRGQTGISIYVNVFLLTVPSLAEDDRRASIDLILEDGEIITFYPYRLEGGQRLLMPSEATEYILDLLMNEVSFSIKLGRNQLDVGPDNFQKSYEALMKIPIRD